jgi:hypothetical protein
MYFITKLNGDRVPSRYGLVHYQHIARLSDYNHPNVKDGISYLVYKSDLDRSDGKAHGIYVTDGGKLIRDKRRSALRKIHDLFRGHSIDEITYAPL